MEGQKTQRLSGQDGDPRTKRKNKILINDINNYGGQSVLKRCTINGQWQSKNTILSDVLFGVDREDRYSCVNIIVCT